MKDYSHLSHEEIYKRAHHILDVKKVAEYCDPFKGCWVEITTPITKQEVLDCIAKGQAQLVETPLWTDIFYKNLPITPEESRINHIKKIAYFATHDIESAISLDVGIPSMNCYVAHMVDDGNHRLAGAIIKGDSTIKATVGGSVDHAKALGLFNPNEYEAYLFEKMEQEIQEQQSKKVIAKFKM